MLCLVRGEHVRDDDAQLERVERLGQEAWHGVAQVDRGGDPPDWGCAFRYKDSSGSSCSASWTAGTIENVGVTR